MHTHSFGHLSGDIDENNLYKLNLKDERLMSRPEILSRKDIAFCFLLDESGSMCGSKMTSAKEVMISLIEGLKDKFNLSLYGHTAQSNVDGKYVDGLVLREYFSKRNPFYKSIHKAQGRVQNFDGMAIKIAAQNFAEDYSLSRRILFHICDGEPYTDYYMGHEAENHVSNVCSAVRKSGTEVYCIGIENAFDQTKGNKMYGKGNFVVLEDVNSSINVLCRFISQICNKNIATYV
jgi:nitric oxide reductase activation protein